MSNTWHRLISRAAILMRRLKSNLGDDDTLWIHTDGELMRGDAPLLPADTTLKTIARPAACILDATENDLGFIVERSTVSDVTWVEFPVGATRLVIFEGRWGVNGAEDEDHTYYWPGGISPPLVGGYGVVTADGYQVVRFTKERDGDIVCTSFNRLEEI